MKWFLFPFTLLFAAATSIRNYLYDKGLFKTYHSKIKTICIGNIQVGGAGKTPMTALLYAWYSKNKKVSILSRGYGRKTQGLIEANQNASPQTIGDEPFWYHNTLHAHTVVAEKRKEGLQFLEKKQTDLVLLDDAFQHRNVTCDVNLVLTDFNKPFYNDCLMPFGRLREMASGLKRADALVFTKCPVNLSEDLKNELLKKVKGVRNVFFSGIEYSEPVALKGNVCFKEKQFKRIIAVSAIANSTPFVEHCQSICENVLAMDFRDHHDYQIADVQKMIALLDENSLVLCTEKDAVKLGAHQFKSIIPLNQFFYIPIATKILFNEASRLKAFLDAKLAKL
jgi:tetraacyldisaccharide 4'-kinase